MLKVKIRCNIWTIIGVMYLIGSFGIIDVWLRVVTRWINCYNIYEIPPNAFTLSWSILLTAIILMFNSKKIGRIVYGVLYFIYLSYAVVQYISYLVLGRFLFVSDFLFAGEGGDYFSYVFEFISIEIVVQVIVLIAIGIMGIYMCPCLSGNRIKRVWIGVVVSCLIAILNIPRLYNSSNKSEKDWFSFLNPAIEYKRFVNSTFDMQLTGMYEYLAHDIKIQVTRCLNKGEKIQQFKTQIDQFFEEKDEHQNNTMTGLFEGKNLIVVMMESIDDWLITEQDMPTLWYMKNSGINFANMYTPQYSNGYTFNTEFAYNTSVYPFSNGNVAYTLTKNLFPNTIANKFEENEYFAKSFHEGTSFFYNRGNMHRALGYEQYHSFHNYDMTGELDILIDTFLPETDRLYKDVVKTEPFYAFIITYSGHLPYNDDDALAQYALKKYPQYDVKENREFSILRAKARITDDMFAGLLQNLERDGLLKDTVIVAFTDHYAYGVDDKDALQKVSEEYGSSILERTPAFIYCADYEESLSVEKTMQITDLAPTIMNLFGMEVPKKIMGQDIFDENYPGWAIFPNATWIMDKAYVKNGNIIWNNEMTEQELKEMNEYVQQVYIINDAILECDYYAID